MRKAGLFARLFAFIIDGLILSLCASLITFIIALISDIDLALGNEYLSVVSDTASIILAITLTFLEFIYFGILWGTYGKTIGMSIFDIKVVRTDGTGISFWRAGLRGTIGYWVSGLIFGIGYIWAAFDTRRQALHDKIFDTLVIKA